MTGHRRTGSRRGRIKCGFAQKAAWWWPPKSKNSNKLFGFLKADKILFDKLPHDSMVARIEFVHCSDKYKPSFIEQRDVVRNLFGAVGNVVGDDHLSQTYLMLHFPDQLVDRL